MAKPSKKIKLSPNLKPFISRVVRNGLAQQAFALRIGYPVGGCVQRGVKRGMTKGARLQVFRECAKQAKTVSVRSGIDELAPLSPQQRRDKLVAARTSYIVERATA
ncbi:MAG: hypothetical protein QXO37_06985 [Candidatus Nitrosocaldaceae archaeon]